MHNIAVSNFSEAEPVGNSQFASRMMRLCISWLASLIGFSLIYFSVEHWSTPILVVLIICAGHWIALDSHWRSGNVYLLVQAVISVALSLYVML